MSMQGSNRDAPGLSRREVIGRTAWVGLGLAAAGPSLVAKAQPAPSDRIVVAVMGVNSRGLALADAFARSKACEVGYICDVDSRAMERAIGVVSSSRQVEREGVQRTLPAAQDRVPRGAVDFRTVLDDPEVDALVVAAPDHWHAPAAMLALDAGKHIYLEKPCSHNAREGELLVAAAARHPELVVQMGNQQRSAPESIEIVQAIHEGLIGRPYYARAWYANRRGPIGTGKPAPVPGWLDYDLWQGPAPRVPYRDNVIHYNWHWFWHWGTGEICNNGTHEIDVCRWALGVDHPLRVGSSGGRYHFDDDWEAFDTQVASFDFSGGRSIVWEGRSCNGRPIEGRGRGSSIHGEKGTVVLDRSGYVVYDHENNEIRRRMRGSSDSALDTRGGGSLTDLHIENFLETVRGRGKLTAPVADARKSQLLCHLGNIAQREGRSLEVNPVTGRIEGDRKAMKLWGREYERGWEPQA
jgi:predicted dehydrogenase